MQTLYGEVIVETPRNRDGSFEPQTVKKHKTILAEGMADQIIDIYAFGTSTRDISKVF
ncbi:transposase, mutator family [Segatella oris C735]|uniref:Mutator family transposase n=1 Tax=Segatella oris C735 TaxID=563008 RepID=D7NAR1_9BACT|nr:transposase, mutator family [Segatella oris C735]